MHGLQPGDRFDVVSALPVKTDQHDLGKTALGGPFGILFQLDAKLSNVFKQASIRVLVQNGVAVTAVLTRQEPKAYSSLTQGTRTPNIPVQEIVIALDPQEVAPLTEAMALEAEIIVVPRSGRPEDPTDSVTPESEPRSLFGGLVTALTGLGRGDRSEGRGCEWN